MFYPLENLLQIELEHAALSPFKFIKYTKDNIPSEGDIKPVVTRILKPQLLPVFFTDDENIPFICVTLLLIPGSRFLFDDTMQHSMHLWDLGIHAGIPMKLSPIAVLPTAPGSFVSVTSPTPDGHGVYVCIEQISLNMDNRVSIYEIYPSSPDVAYRLTHSLKVKGTLDNAYIYKNTLACSYCDNLITVWDFVENKAISWEYNHVIHQPNGAILFADTLLLVEPGKLTIWDVLSSLYLLVSDDTKAAVIQLLPRLEIHALLTAQSLRVSPPSQWLSAGQLRLPLFGLCSPTPDALNASMRYYTFKYVPSNLDYKTFDPQQVGIGSFPISTMSLNFLQHIRFCGKSLALTWQANGNINISLMNMPQGDHDGMATPATRRLFNREEYPTRKRLMLPAVFIQSDYPRTLTKMSFNIPAEDHSEVVHNMGKVELYDWRWPKKLISMINEHFGNKGGKVFIDTPTSVAISQIHPEHQHQAWASNWKVSSLKSASSQLRHHVWKSGLVIGPPVALTETETASQRGGMWVKHRQASLWAMCNDLARQWTCQVIVVRCWAGDMALPCCHHASQRAQERQIPLGIGSSIK
ncbi:uncharacterized protein LACBIDRAFT_324637 [Laccaria bicolor S238N-H82]|uniref:Predicted protein n=1 Tax=Laccaria bicolor (strain S238N-H82 / ATCC MYA-4686) TaxID=486041 RepID=B0D2J7_LACBS|nr:uncharacterized protein LACBIDRAFT_324637 [Laccaria bicolor S238N-H82]EDR10763.1 predicted protein [Laccaria bicolor S238N-H82]|eukprot:XP_001878064.1 predicted protein [Laccaria bicolor S238N-H82]